MLLKKGAGFELAKNFAYHMVVLRTKTLKAHIYLYHKKVQGELTVIFLGCPFLQGPSRCAVCVN